MAQNNGMSDGTGNRNFVFLTVNDFSKDGGGSLRMYGIVNSLAAQGCAVTLISNTSHPEKFHSAVRHIALNRCVSKREKRIIQGMISWLPCVATAFIFRKLLLRLNECIARCPQGADMLYSFEYLDNSLAYLLKKRGYISRYVNDTHGMAALEFDAQLEATSNPLRKLKFLLKRISAKKLDRKVFTGASGVIYGGSEMQRYYETDVIARKDKPDALVIPFAFAGDPAKPYDRDLTIRLRAAHRISDNDFLFLFAGSYKITSGIDNLIDAFGEIHSDAPNTKLMLIGSAGPLWESCREKVRQSLFGDAVIFIDGIPYDELTAYQQLAAVIVCPDRANLFSDYIVHTKYFDALWSGKPVICGRFASMKHINPDDALSLSFDPADPDDLRRAMLHSLGNHAALVAKYERNRETVLEKFTYHSYASALAEWNDKLKA